MSFFSHRATPKGDLGHDAGAPWSTATDYVGVDNEPFTFAMPATVANGPYVAATGETLEAGKTYSLMYAADRTAAASLATIADDAATVSEVSLMNLIGSAATGSDTWLDKNTGESPDKLATNYYQQGDVIGPAPVLTKGEWYYIVQPDADGKHIPSTFYHDGTGLKTIVAPSGVGAELTLAQVQSLTGIPYTSFGSLSAERLDQWEQSRTLQLTDADTSTVLRGGFDYEITANNAATFRLSDNPAGTVRIRMGGGSTFPLTIEQFNTGAAANLLALEDSSAVKSFEIGANNKNEHIHINANGTGWRVHRDWIIRNVVDNAATWSPGTAYAADVVFYIEPAVAAADIDGNMLQIGQKYFYFYPTTQTSGATLDADEIAKMRSFSALDSGAVYFPGDSGQMQVDKINVYFRDQSVGATPTIEASAVYALAVVQANTTDAQTVKDAAKVRMTHYSAVDTGAGLVWLETEPFAATEFIQHKDHHEYLAFNSSYLTITDVNTVIGFDRRMRASHVVVANGPGHPGMSLPAGTSIIDLVWGPDMNGTTVNVGIAAAASSAHRILDLDTGVASPSVVGADSGNAVIVVSRYRKTPEGTYIQLSVSNDIPFDLRLGAYTGDSTPAWESDMLWFANTAPLMLPAYQVRQTKLTNQAAAEDTTVIVYDNTDGTAVLTIGNAPAGEVITNVLFFQYGTTTPAGGSFVRFAPNVVGISGVNQDVDIEIVTQTSVAPELRLVEVPFYVPSGIFSNNGTKQSAQYNLTPGAKVKATAYVTGYASGNATYGMSLSILNSAGTRIAGNIANELDSFLIREEPWAVVNRSSVDNQSQRGPMHTLAVPNITVPPDGIVSVLIQGHDVFRDGEARGIFTVVDNVTIAATERIQTQVTLTVAGVATVDDQTDSKVSASEATLHTNLGADIVLDLGSADNYFDPNATTETGCVYNIRYSTRGTATLNVKPTGTGPATIAVAVQTVSPPGVTVHVFQQSNTEAGPVGSIEGWQFAAPRDFKQGRIVNSSGKQRIIKSVANAARLDGTPGALYSTNYGAITQGLDDGDMAWLTSSNIDLSVGGGAATGQCEYAVFDCYELDSVDRLKFVKLHTLYISMAVGTSFAWTNNDWRVEVHTP